MVILTAYEYVVPYNITVVFSFYKPYVYFTEANFKQELKLKKIKNVHYKLYRKCCLDQGCPDYCLCALRPIKTSESWVINKLHQGFFKLYVMLELYHPVCSNFL